MRPITKNSIKNKKINDIQLSVNYMEFCTFRQQSASLIFSATFYIVLNCIKIGKNSCLLVKILTNFFIRERELYFNYFYTFKFIYQNSR